MPMLYTTLGGLAVVLALFTLTAHDKVLAAVTIPLIGAFGFATVPPLLGRCAAGRGRFGSRRLVGGAGVAFRGGGRGSG
jgi:hypothetical protein